MTVDMGDKGYIIERYGVFGKLESFGPSFQRFCAWARSLVYSKQ